MEFVVISFPLTRMSRCAGIYRPPEAISTGFVRSARMKRGALTPRGWYDSVIHEIVQAGRPGFRQGLRSVTAGGRLGGREDSREEVSDVLFRSRTFVALRGTSRSCSGLRPGSVCPSGPGPVGRSLRLPDLVRPESGQPLRGGLLRPVRVPDLLCGWRQGRVHAVVQRLRAAVHRLRCEWNRLVRAGALLGIDRIRPLPDRLEGNRAAAAAGRSQRERGGP